MAKKAKNKSPSDASRAFPYTNKPGSLRRFLKQIPERPKPQKFDQTMLHSWGFKDGNDYSILRVLKAVNLLNSQNEPTDVYSRFMDAADGARALGPEIERVYKPLFEASHEPYKENNERLKNLFNIHSGGGSIELQIQTFKALCENAVFGADDAVMPRAPASSASPRTSANPQSNGAEQGPVVHINLHIHLPENKSRRDYEDIIENIGRHIFGRPRATDA